MYTDVEPVASEEGPRRNGRRVKICHEWSLKAPPDHIEFGSNAVSSSLIWDLNV